MRNKLYLPVIIGLILLFSLATTSYATTSEAWSMFRVYTSPAWVAGENGLITIPTTGMIGSGKIALCFSGIDSGKIQDDEVVFSTYSLHYDLGNFLELGVTRKSILWDWKRTDVEGETFNAKLRLKKGTLPIAVGVIALNLSGDPHDWSKRTEDSIFLNLFAVTSLELAGFNLNVGAEIGALGDDKTDPFFFAGIDKKIGGLLLMGELIGTNEQAEDGIFNAGVSLNLGKKLKVGVSAYDVGEDNRIMVQSSLKF